MPAYLHRLSATALVVVMAPFIAGCPSQELLPLESEVADVEPSVDVRAVDGSLPAVDSSLPDTADTGSVEDVAFDVTDASDEGPPPEPDPGPEPDTTPEPDVPDVLGPDNPPQFGAAVPVMNNFYPSLGDISLAVDDEGRVSALFAHTVQVTGGTYGQLVLAVSDPAVTFFQEPVVVTPLNGTGESDLTIADDHHLMVWTDKSTDSDAVEVRFRRATLPDLAGDDLVLGSGSAKIGRAHV